MFCCNDATRFQIKNTYKHAIEINQKNIRIPNNIFINLNKVKNQNKIKHCKIYKIIRI